MVAGQGAFVLRRERVLLTVSQIGLCVESAARAC